MKATSIPGLYSVLIRKTIGKPQKVLFIIGPTIETCNELYRAFSCISSQIIIEFHMKILKTGRKSYK